MTTSPAKSSLSAIRRGKPIPEEALVYVVARAQAAAYDFVLTKFLERERNDELSRADLARMLAKGPAQITRWLSSPHNWTIETVAKLLLAIERSELEFKSVPIESTAGQANSGTGWDDVSRPDFGNAQDEDADTSHQESGGSAKSAKFNPAVHMT